ncbi:hypothetical protein EBR04_04690, partial [bacterium]|nr:hypothetical protein [bacterium]
YDLSAGVYDPTSGHLFITAYYGTNGSQLVELDPATGAKLATIDVGIDVRTWSGLAIDPTTGHLWLGSTSGGPQVIEYRIGGVGVLTEVGRFSTVFQGLDEQEISGLSFAADGTLWASSTRGDIYRLNLGRDDVTVPTATLTSVNAVAAEGTPADAGKASANVGDVIELVGTNFGSWTRVLFQTRDSEGVLNAVSVAPLSVYGGGTRLTVQVPDLATTADVRVVNQGARDLATGGVDYSFDAVYRGVTVSFIASGTTATVQFAGRGLDDVSSESWGLDNVKVTGPGNAPVFADDFESGAKPAWSDPATRSDLQAAVSRFSGRFGNVDGINRTQSLALSGLTAGTSYTVTFDLYAFDSWDGASGNYYYDNLPDTFSVSVDGQSLLAETLANYRYNGGVQTFRASAGIPLQIVPTLRSIDGLPGGEDSFTLTGSGFMEGATTVTVGGVSITDQATNGYDFNVFGSRNGQLSTTAPIAVTGPIRVTTAGGFAELPAPALPSRPATDFTGITAAALVGTPTDVSKPSANTGQQITLIGRGFRYDTQVEFTAVDDTGRLGTVVRTGSASYDGTQLTINVPALARTGAVRVQGSSTAIDLQVVPTLLAGGGAVAAGNTIYLGGTGLTASDLVVTVDGVGVGEFRVTTLVDGSAFGSYSYGPSVDLQQLAIVVPQGVTAGQIRVATAGGQAVLAPSSTTLSGVSGSLVSRLPDLVPAGDVGDTLATALTTGLGTNQAIRITAAIASLDVDIFSVELAAGDKLIFSVPNGPGFDGYMRLYNAAGEQRFSLDDSSGQFTADDAGTYFIGLSRYGVSYDPQVSGSATGSPGVGSFTLDVTRLSSTVSGVGTPLAADSGTPTNAGIASANVGQYIVFSAPGIVADDRVVFTTIDSSGSLGETTVNPLTLDVANGAILVAVPANATTGRVRLEREPASGVVLQVVPTVAAAQLSTGSAYGGNTLTLTGSGFAEGLSRVTIGDRVIFDTSRSGGIGVGYSFVANDWLTLTLPSDAPVGPITVTTPGGTSTVLSVAVTGLAGTAASGTPANAAIASANPGDTVTLSGANLSVDTRIIFPVVDSYGRITTKVVRPTIVADDGTSAIVTVPLDAVTGTVRVLGSAAAFPLQVVPVVTDAQIDWASEYNGTVNVSLTGYGFVDNAADSFFGFGTDSFGDAGPNVSVSSAGSGDEYRPNGRVQLTIPLTADVFAAITAITAGGTSGSFTRSLASVEATAFSGELPLPAGPSANPGQAVALLGSGLSADTDVIVRYLDGYGSARATVVRPSFARADGTHA